MESTVLGDAVKAGVLESTAVEFCDRNLTGPNRVAAFATTADGIRDIAGDVAVAEKWDAGLPTDDAPVWVCVFSVAGQFGIDPELTYAAYWGNTSTSALLTVW